MLVEERQQVVAGRALVPSGCGGMVATAGGSVGDRILFQDLCLDLIVKGVTEFWFIEF